MAVDPNKVCHGRPCKNCGETLRWKRNHSCVACDRERRRERRRERYASDPKYRERELERWRKWYANHPEYRERRRERYRTDEEYRERELERVREWYYNLDHIAYYERQLKDRRRKALKRKEARHANDT